MKKKDGWTVEEENMVLDNYISKGPTWISQQLNRTLASIKNKAKRLNIILYSPIPWTDREIQFMIDNYSTCGRKWVCEKLGRSRGSVQKKAKDLNLKVLFYEKKDYSYDEMCEAVKKSSNMSQLCMELGKVKSGASFRVIKRNLFRHRIDISHFNSYNKQIKNINKGRPIEEYLIYGSSINTVHVKNRLYKENIKQRQCEKCGQGEEWKGEYMSLILDHINGDTKDNRIENLRILCPNCNATLPTHCRGKKVFIKR